MLPVRLIDPNREQPRRSFDEQALADLAQSIRAVGVLQPIIVRPNGDRFTIIAGERRYRASRLAELEEIPAIVRDWDEQTRLEAALIENLQRDDLNPHRGGHGRAPADGRGGADAGEGRRAAGQEPAGGRQPAQAADAAGHGAADAGGRQAVGGPTRARW